MRVWNKCPTNFSLSPGFDKLKLIGHQTASPPGRHWEGRPNATTGSLSLTLSWSKTAPVFDRVEECLDHFGSNEVAVGGLELIEPEIVTVKVSIRSIVRISSQVTEILHLHERPVQLAGLEGRVLCDEQQKN